MATHKQERGLKMGIDVYLTVSFWMGVVAIALRGLCLCGATYPRTPKHSVGSDVFSLMVSIAFLVWVCYLRNGL